MASSYVLPNPTAPRDHWSSYMQPPSNVHSHAHSHSTPHLHSHSHSPHRRSPLGNSPDQTRGADADVQPAWAGNGAAFALNGGVSGHDHDHDHNHDHDHDHDHGHDDHDHDHDRAHGHDHPHVRAHSHIHDHTYSLDMPVSPGTAARESLYEKMYPPPTESNALFEQQNMDNLSRVTNFMLQRTVEWPILHAIMKDGDSRRIFYFMSLNFAFMLVQAFYGYITDSLGLLSDSIHMFFDCVALAVGLFAAVASKWQPNERFPYGFGKIETLSGFANGIFLILISVEIMVEAFERILGGRETQRLWELFVVSTLGLLVNLVGMFSFGHHHHHGDGHDCSHSHDHVHDHDHDHAHAHDHDHDHDHDGHAHDHKHEGASHSHGHSHGNENMYGIYLHVLADTLGSGAVIVSTVLTHFWGWSGWDPLASFLIAVLILGSAVPLVSSSARRLLLTIPDALEYSLQGTLADLAGLPGVASYSAPRFWIDDRAGSQEKLLGVIHVVASRGADAGDVRDRVRNFLLEKGIDVVLQVEREGDGNCWCTAGRAPSMSGRLGHGSKPSIVF